MLIHANDANKKQNSDLIYAKESYLLTGLCFVIHNNLGRFCREKQYADEFERSLQDKQIKYQREYRLNNENDNFSGNVVDFVINDKILVDLKAKNFLTKEDYYQMLRYLKVANLKLGLLVNFRNSHLKPKRVINNQLN